MTRPVALIALVLGFLTAFAVGQFGMLLTNPASVSDPRAAMVPDAAEIVQAFYAGMENWITSGDLALDLLVTPEFIDHAMAGEPTRDRSAFFANLTSIRATTTAPDLVITRMTVAGAIVSVELTGSPGSIVSIPGWSVALAEDIEFREVLRIEGHRIAERWHTSDPWPYGFWSVDRPLPAGIGQLHQPSIQGFELDADTEAGLFSSGTVVVVDDVGTMFVDQSGRDLTGNVQPAYEPIEAGEVRIVESDVTLRVRNPTGRATRFWTISLEQILPPRTPPDAPAGAKPLGIRQFANVSIAVSLSDTAAHMSVGAMTVPAGATLSTYGSGMKSIGVLGGQLQIESSTGRGYYSADSTRFRAVFGAETATAGQGFAGQAGGSASYRVTGNVPATLLFLTVTSTDAPTYHPLRTGPG